MKKIIPILAIAAASLMLAVMPALGTNSGSSPIPASVTVIDVCGLTVNNAALEFKKGANDLLQGETSDALGRNVDLDANTQTTVTIFGEDWSGLDPANIFGVGQTEYGLDVPSLTPLTTNTDTELFASDVDELHTVNFQVTIPDPQPADTYSQTITIGFTC